MEMLLLSDQALTVVTIDAAGRRTERTLLVGWLRSSLDERPGRTPALVVRAAGVDVEIAASLGEDEKRALADALRLALDRQRHPTFDNPQLRDVSPPSVPLI